MAEIQALPRHTHSADIVKPQKIIQCGARDITPIRFCPGRSCVFKKNVY
jgi:hypothetical protein